ncbi:hypothetical protein LMG29542_08634 [Paraburkholderia humisilvae]|uniref:Uncharacterized protein n=1 Tax=Paraburkholderia humisilvae TaxID=627669 RepID=A0A6J5FBZ7_9BURK|nr:hypothetical protein LMG29542_08634 [Paraburkholderia humisilvae]
MEYRNAGDEMIGLSRADFRQTTGEQNQGGVPERKRRHRL